MDKHLFARIVRNVTGASGARVLSLAFSFLSVPLLLRLLGQEGYGTWVALTSILLWIPFFDFGVGNTLRNSAGGVGVSRTPEQVRVELLGVMRFLYLITLVGMGLLLAVGAFVPLFSANWGPAVLLYGIYILSYPLTMGGSVLQGMGSIALVSFLQVGSTALFFLLLAGCLQLQFNPGVAFLGAAFSLSWAVSGFVMFVLALSRLGETGWRLREWMRQPIPVNRLGVSMGFVVLQGANLILYFLGNVIAYNSMGGAAAARFDLINRVMQVGLSFFLLLISSVWTEASRFVAQNDMESIRRLHMRLLWVTLAFVAALLLSTLLVPEVVMIWTGRAIQVSSNEALAVALMVAAQAFMAAGSVFLSAFERLRTLVILMSLAALLMLPLTHALLALGMGITAVPLAAAMLTVVPAAASHLTVRRLCRS